MSLTIDVKDKNEQIPPKRVAVLISNGIYQDDSIPDLVGPEIDAHNLDQMLGHEEYGKFETHSLVNEGFYKVRHQIALISEKCEINDLLLIYYSGCGFLRDDRLFLPVADTILNTAYATALNANFLLSALSKSKANKKILILDTCHAGAFFRNTNSGIPDGLVVIASCGTEEASGEGVDGGYFTSALIDGLRENIANSDSVGRVSIEKAFEQAKKILLERHPSQIPQIWFWNLPETINLIFTKPSPIFVSYSRKDTDFVKALHNQIEAGGIPTWIDQDGIKGGDDWLQKIASSIKKSQLIVTVLSSGSMESRWVRRELEFADENSIPILPVVIDKTLNIPDWFQLRFNTHQRLECDPVDPESVSGVVNRIVQLYAEISSAQETNKLTADPRI